MNHSSSNAAPICNTTESSAMNTVNNMKDPAQNELPVVMTFKDLHIPENFELAPHCPEGSGRPPSERSHPRYTLDELRLRGWQKLVSKATSPAPPHTFEKIFKIFSKVCASLGE